MIFIYILAIIGFISLIFYINIITRFFEIVLKHSKENGLNFTDSLYNCNDYLDDMIKELEKDDDI